MKTFLRKFLGVQNNFSQKVKLDNLYLFGFAILSLFTITSCGLLPCTDCMIEPWEDQNKPKDQPVHFRGSVSAPSSSPTKITIQAKQGNNWMDIGQATSINSDNYLNDYWHTWLKIPDNYWLEQINCAVIEWSALVRSKSPQGFLDALNGDAWDCATAHPGQFESYCLSPQTPVAQVVDDRDFGKECAAQINKIRALEGKQPLIIDEAGECDADADAKCNYEWELTNPEPHKCQHGGQNECDYRSASSTIEEILVDCMWKQMYLCEKKLYETGQCDINLCRVCPYPGTGHYKNYTNTEYTKVSCGLYKTPDGKYKSVQNFFK